MERISSPAVVTSATDARRQMMLPLATQGFLPSGASAVRVHLRALLGVWSEMNLGTGQ
jgi:hypothetical protein